ncbi:lipocalin family protein [Bizionia myxarmorum]|uniref:Lipocalin-like domain-containing protein n=1 Tax=Bizionia myxarmorum TaxID=291186 RepID=A0A5D0RCT8_9FLAO|nr:lipocalin family protein [Bizionia myxarmorum]TYB78615.1 hypothetical protein ES674_02210 [Bizionia myxarmorum]
MKKLILLLSVLALTVSSCSSDDDVATVQESFVGTWKFYKAFEDGVEVVYDTCDYEDTIIVDGSGTFTTNGYQANVNGGCDLTNTETGTWLNLGNGMYSLTSDGETYTEEIKFEENRMYFDEVDGGTVYREVYIKQ